MGMTWQVYLVYLDAAWLQKKPVCLTVIGNRSGLWNLLLDGIMIAMEKACS